MITYSTGFFTATADGHELTSCASDLGPSFLDRIWEDACDQGFGILSPDGTKTAIFVFDSELRRDGELAGWTFRAWSSLQPVTATIFND